MLEDVQTNVSISEKYVCVPEFEIHIKEICSTRLSSATPQLIHKRYSIDFMTVWEQIYELALNVWLTKETYDTWSLLPETMDDLIWNVTESLLIILQSVTECLISKQFLEIQTSWKAKLCGLE